MSEESRRYEGNIVTRKSSTRVFLIKLLHSLIYVFMSLCVVYPYHAALTETYDWKLAFAVSTIALEGIILLLSGRRCPLSTWAKRLGDESGDDLIADTLLPRWAVQRTVPFCTLVFLSGLVVLLVSYLYARGLSVVLKSPTRLSVMSLTPWA